MSLYGRRIETLKVLIAGSVVSRSTAYTSIEGELSAAASTVRIPQLPRRYLLQVLHTTRCLDSTLSSFINHHAVTCTKQSLGGYLYALKNNAGHATLTPLSEPRRANFQTKIVDVRNTYMHQAGAFPASEAESMTLLSEMHTCLVEVFAL